jgi:hypothetical protein
LLDRALGVNQRVLATEVRRWPKRRLQGQNHLRSSGKERSMTGRSCSD